MYLYLLELNLKKKIKLCYLNVFFQVFVLLFIFVKREVMRFAMKSRRGPHVPLGHNAPKVTHTPLWTQNVILYSVLLLNYTFVSLFFLACVLKYFVCVVGAETRN